MQRSIHVVIKFLESFPFSRAVWLAPAAYAAHFVEENAGFPRWVTAHFPVTFSQAQFHRNGIVLMAILIGLCLLIPRSRGKAAGLLFLTYASGLFLHNGLFHLGATVILQAYSPGLVTGILLYLPLSSLLAIAAMREDRIGRAQIMVVLVVGGLVHYAVIISQLTL